MQEATEMLKEVDAKLEPSDSGDLTSIFRCARCADFIWT